MSPRRRVLVTGAYGLVGNAIYRRLADAPDRYDAWGLVRRRAPSARLPGEQIRLIPDDHLFVADLGDPAALQQAMDGMDAVVHMAAEPNGDAPWESILANNIVGAYNVFEACRLAGVKRLVYASTLQIFMGYMVEATAAFAEGRVPEMRPGDIPTFTHDSLPRPMNYYGASKIWGEGMAFMYAHRYDMSCLVLRVGMVEAVEPPPAYPFGIFAWCSQRDIAQIGELCVSAPESLRFDIFQGLSDNAYNFADIQHAREVLGYQPQDGLRVSAP
jgi:NAD+ dependent glucose-6-phosphate dehydrogenase